MFWLKNGHFFLVHGQIVNLSSLFMALIKIKKSNKYIIHAEQVCQKIIQKRRKEKYEDKKEKMF